MTERKMYINEEMTKGLTYSTARYKWETRHKKDKRNLTYKTITKEYLQQLGVSAISKVDPKQDESGWQIIRSYPNKYGDMIQRWSLIITGRYANGGCRTARYVNFWDRKEQKLVRLSLAIVLYAWFVDEVPATYVVDHKNNNSMDDRLENYQVLTRSENVKKDSTGHNQFTPEKDRVHKKIDNVNKTDAKLNR